MKFGTRAIGSSMKKHTPVLVDEVLHGLDVREGKRYIDATFGFGGHSREIAKRGGVVLGIDVDPDTEANHGNFRDIETIAKENGFDTVDGVLFDLGVSSNQLDTPERGFSFRYPDAPLDFRMDPSQGIPASEYIRRLSEEELYEILAKFGEEERAGPIAHAICRTRSVNSIKTTGDLARVIGGSMKTKARVFQAIRIAVNDELEALKEGLAGAVRLLTIGGRLAVVSYHSLEDRIVKREIERLGLRPINKRPMTPRANEIQENHRSRSAKLRIAVK